MAKITTPADLLGALKHGPARLAAVAKAATDIQLHAPPEPGEWSARDVLAHMRACGDTWGAAVDTILGGADTLKAVNPRWWVRQTDYFEIDFRDSLRAYTKQRKALVRRLESLAPEDWERTATVTGAGAPLTRSVRHYAAWLANHERPHLRQIERAVSAAEA